jgi:hypothetical protein
MICSELTLTCKAGNPLGEPVVFAGSITPLEHGGFQIEEKYWHYTIRTLWSNEAFFVRAENAPNDLIRVTLELDEEVHTVFFMMFFIATGGKKYRVRTMAEDRSWSNFKWPWVA